MAGRREKMERLDALLQWMGDYVDEAWELQFRGYYKEALEKLRKVEEVLKEAIPLAEELAGVE